MLSRHAPNHAHALHVHPASDIDDAFFFMTCICLECEEELQIVYVSRMFLDWPMYGITQCWIRLITVYSILLALFEK